MRLLILVLVALALVAGRVRQGMLYVPYGGCGESQERTLQTHDGSRWVTIRVLREGDCARSTYEMLKGTRTCCLEVPGVCSYPTESEEPVQCVNTYSF